MKRRTWFAPQDGTGDRKLLNHRELMRRTSEDAIMTAAPTRVILKDLKKGNFNDIQVV